MAKASALETKETLSPVLPDLCSDVDVIDGRFEVLGGIGGGAYGMVYKARDKETDSIVALKRVSVVENSEGVGLPPLLLREVSNLKRLSSPHIVMLLGVHESCGRYVHEAVWYLVFEYMEQDLDNFIKNSSSGLSNCITKDFLGQILEGVDVMHVNHIVHRDLKPQNILVSRDGRNIKIADFGLSRQIGSNIVLSTQVVTQWYRAPEVLLHSSYSESVDMWSVGCIFAEMIAGRPLFAVDDQGEKAQLEKIFRIIGTPVSSHWPSESHISLTQFPVCRAQPWSNVVRDISQPAQDLLTKFLRFDASRRILAQTALKHEYFNESIP